MHALAQPSLVTGRTVLSLFGFNPDWAYTVDLYALLAMLVRGSLRMCLHVCMYALANVCLGVWPCLCVCVCVCVSVCLSLALRACHTSNGLCGCMQVGWFLIGLVCLVVFVRERR
jgi:hypothetical protein